MTKFKETFLLEFKHLFCLRNLIILALFILILAYVVNVDCHDYKNTIAEADDFQKTESLMFSKITSYTLYQIFGFRVHCIPDTASILFYNSCMLSAFKSRINGLFHLNIFDDLKGQALFKNRDSTPLDFSSILKVFGTLYAILFLGFTALRNKEYLKMLSSIMSKGVLFTSILLSRIIVLTLNLILIFAAAIAVVKSNHIKLVGADISGLLVFLVSFLGLLLFFFSLGTAIGQIIPETGKGTTVIIVTWVVLVFFLSGAVNSIVLRSAKKITSNHKTEFEKLNLSFEFEKRNEEKYGKFDRNNIEVERKIIEGFLDNDYKRIMALEKRQKSEIAAVVDKYNKLFLCTPITFFTLTANEISSQGYGSFLNFYTYLFELQVKFVRFLIDRTYYNDPKVMVNFIKGDENLFYSESRIPQNFLPGLLITVGWIVMVLILLYCFFKRDLFRLSGQDLKCCSEANVNFKKGVLQVWRIKGENFKNLLYNIFSGRLKGIKKNGHSMKVHLDEVNITEVRNKEDFLYFCQGEDIPGDIRVKYLILFFARLMKVSKDKRQAVLDLPEIKDLTGKRFARLSRSQKAEVIFALISISKSNIYLLHNIGTGMSFDFSVRFKKQMESLSNKGALVIYLTTDDTDVTNREDDLRYFYQTDKWTGIIEAHLEEQEK